MIDPAARESALIIPVRLPAALATMRQHETIDGPLGVPGHVTLLYPFAPPATIDRGALDAVAAVVGMVPAFDAWFRDVRRFEPSGSSPAGVVWLAPEPEERFSGLIAALTTAFPEYPIYGGEYETVVPHVSLSALDRHRADDAEAEARRWLPFRRRVAVATLIVEGRDGRWRTRRRFRLADPGEA